VEQGLFLAVTPKMVQDASGEEPGLMVCIDKPGRTAANSTLLQQNLVVRLIFCMYKRLSILM
jgi:hypothetical protein